MRANHETILISPDMAEKWLKQNTNNRRLDKAVVRRYANDITTQNWTESNNGIAFDTKGTLIDGQHRLHAIIRANKSVEMLVSRNLPAGSKLNIDTGKRRTFSDIITMEQMIENTKDSGAISQAISKLIKYESGMSAQSSSIDLTTNSKMKDYLDNHCSELHENINFLKSISKSNSRIATIGTALATFTILRRINESEADDFMSKTYGGFNLSIGTPEVFVRDIFMGMKNKTSKRKLSDVDFLYFCIKAWNSIRRGRPIKEENSIRYNKLKNGAVENKAQIRAI